MPTYTAPSSVADRLNTLETTLAATGKDSTLASLVPAALRADIVTFVPIYAPLAHAVDAALAGRAQEVVEKDAALGNLITHVRDFLEVLKRRTVRLKHNVAVLVHYGLPQSGDVPRLRTADEVLPVARAILAGEAAAVAAGFPAMANPTAPEVDAALKAFQKEAAEVAPADAAVRTAQAAAAKQRPRADDLIADVKDEVSHALRKEEASTIRRVLRQLGYVFTPNPGEQPEPSPPSPAPGQ
ncbi:MAG: hypothetical protein ACOYMN_12955 [Roseimicrobium sp.]